MKKPNFVQKAAKFISGNGFYLVLLVCVGAIGVSGYFLVRSVMDGVGEAAVSTVGQAQVAQDDRQTAAADDPVVSEVIRPSVRVEKEVEAEPVQTDKPVPIQTPPPSASPEVSAPQPSAIPSAEPKPVPLVFTWPVNGAVIASYSVETLVYDETMLDWRVHEGIDLAASEGTRVLCAAAGTVTEVYEDELMGVTVVVDHGDGLVSVYANLEEEPAVEAGIKVYTGDILGAVGRTAAAESGRDAHLHFAMYEDGTPVDPEEYLPED